MMDQSYIKYGQRNCYFELTVFWVGFVVFFSLLFLGGKVFLGC